MIGRKRCFLVIVCTPSAYASTAVLFAQGTALRRVFFCAAEDLYKYVADAVFDIFIFLKCLLWTFLQFEPIHIIHSFDTIHFGHRTANFFAGKDKALPCLQRKQGNAIK